MCTTDFPNNIILDFRLLNEDGEELFMENITSTRTAIYDDGTGMLVEEVFTTAADHELRQGITLTLSPGVYRVLSWANMGENTSTAGDHTALYLDNYPDIYPDYPDGPIVTYTGAGDNDYMVGNGDRLFYAPSSVVPTRRGNLPPTRQGNSDGEYIMVVDEGGYEGILDFRHAHRTIEVYVKGFRAEGDVFNPTVRISGLPGGLTYLGMGRLTDYPTATSTLRSEPVTIEDEEGVFALAAFDTFLFRMNEEEEMVLDIIDPVNENQVYSATLWDLLTEAGEDPTADDPDKFEPIRVLIEFLSLDEVEVKIPGWNTGDVGYGFFD
jgi:hypothetical protein